MSVNIEELVNSVQILGSDTISSCDDKLRTITAENRTWLNTQLNSAMTQLLTQFRADTSLTYSASEVDTKLTQTMPVGAMIPISQDINTLDGYLYCNGQAISRTTYSNLFSKIGTIGGEGDGSTTFNLPDHRGVFLRGFDDARGLDSGRAFGSYQEDEFKSHNHSASVSSAGEHTHSIYGTFYSNSDAGTSGVGYDSGQGSNSMTSTSPAGNHSHTITIYNTGSTETRPKNIAYKWFIKY